MNILELDKVPMTTGKLIHKAYKPLNIWESSILNYALMSIFVVTDYMALTDLFNSNTYLSFEVRFITSLALAIALDVPLAMSACCVKEYFADLRDRKTTIVITVASVTLFAAVFSVQMWYKLRISDGSDLNLLMALLPLFTSVGSFVFSFYSYCPAREIEKQKLLIESDAETLDMIMNAALDEINNGIYEDIQKINEDAEYVSAKAKSDAIKEMLKESVRNALAQRMGNPQSTETAATK